MTINIGHFYHDLLNLYGESGNIKAIQNYFKEQNIKTSIKLISINDEIKLDDFDLIYIGSGTENNLEIVLNHLKKYQTEIKKYIESGKTLISTGNSLELFGKKIVNNDALNIFDYEIEASSSRIVDEALFKSKLINEYIIGFQNRNNIMKDNSKNNLFDVIKGSGNMFSCKEGYHYKNFYGTYLIGPLLVRNPCLLEYIGNKIIILKNINNKISKNVLLLEKKAYNSFIDNYYKEYK